MTTQNRRPIAKTVLLLAVAACPAVALALGSGCGLSVAGPLDFDPLAAETSPPREGAVADGEEPDGDLPDGACPTACSADGGQVVDCKGAVVTTCDAGSACTANASCVALPWTPARIPGVTLWLRADKGIAADAGTAVDLWQDQSGKAHDVTQGIAASRPVVSAFASGTPAVDFAGNRWLENAATSLVASNSAYAVLLVGQAASNTQGPLFTLRRGPSFSTSLFSTAGAITFVHADGVGITDQVADLTATIVVPFQSVHAYSGGTMAPQLSVNGTNRPFTGTPMQATETGPVGFFVSLSVANLANPGQNQYWNGKIAEIVVIEGTLLPADRAAWDAYAKARYALP